MRIRKIKINQWRYFENINLQLDDQTSLICIVGANGTGKTHLLELIAACAYKLGLSPGIEIPRGDRFSDRHDFSLQFYLTEGVSVAIDKNLRAQPVFAEWDRTLTIQSAKLPNSNFTRIEAGGITDVRQQASFAALVVGQLQNSKDVQFLSLDADRAYPKKNIDARDLAQAYDIDWEGVEYTRGRSFRTTTTLYDEWIKYFLAQENQSGTRLIREIRRARQAGEAEPVFSDHFEAYKEALRKVLPHLIFTGVDSKKRTLLFDTTGLELSFSQLSGGEREIAFLIGQIDRFGLRQGLFLLDEPELHLNADLIRTWVAYLTGSVQTGQIWLATHSLEAVEAAGQHATFILERNNETNKVDSLARLDTRPILSALSRAVGTPAFSISQLLFIFVEGEEGIGERERFRKLASLPQNVRFLECGSCKEVLRRIEAIRAIAQESEVGIRVGAVIDRDFRSDATASELSGTHGVFVLPVHEVENFFLHPLTLCLLLEQNGRAEILPMDLIGRASDERAGSWIFQHTMATKNAISLPEISPLAKEYAKAISWSQLESDREAMIRGIMKNSGFGLDDQKKVKDILEISIDSYARKRGKEDLWKICEGKQVLNNVSRAAGFSGPQALTQAAFTLWSRDESRIPEELRAFREYLARL
jgi:energy-coupling factor transporter ATP-binding protein EcfA2